MDVVRLCLFVFLLPSFFFIPSHTQTESFTSILISQNGLDFVKNLLVNKAIDSIIPLQIPRIEKSVKIPFLGGIDVVVSNLTIYEVDVASSYVNLGETGVVIVASGTTCNLSMNWHYTYSSTWLAPIEISDQGSASVQVEGMEIGLSLGLQSDQGGLKLSLSECGCHVKDINIELEGGASWFYQGMVNAFKDQIGASVESTIAKKLTDGVSDLDSFLRSLPKEIPVDDIAALNVTITDNPILRNSSITFEIDGLFTKRETNQVFKPVLRNSVSSDICPGDSSMLGISMDEAVLNSAAALYYNADFMQWIVDKVPEQSLLNTAKYRFIIPQLYKKYPNRDMNLNITLSSPPLAEISEQYVGANVNADLVINVLEENEVIPVSCIALEIHGSGALRVMDNNLGGKVSLEDFSMSLKWSNIGKLHMQLIQPIVRTVIQTVFVPYANDHLEKGFPLPIIHGFTLQNTEIICSSSEITVCSDVAYVDSSQQPWSHLRLPSSTHWETKL